MNRYPRPQGATLLSQAYQREPTKYNRKALRQHLILMYTNGLLLTTDTTHTFLVPKAKGLKQLSSKSQPKQENKTQKNTIGISTIRRVTLEELSIGLGISVDKMVMRVESFLAHRAKKTVTNKGYQEINLIATRVALLGLKNKSWEVMLGTLDWAEELKAVTRINGYNAMQTKEANSGIANTLTSIKMVAELMKLLNPTQSLTAIQNNFGKMPDTTEQGMQLTPAMALKLLDEKGYTNIPLDTDALAIIHGLGDSTIPSVRALPEDAQGIKAFDVKDLKYLSHTDRRPEELGIEPDNIPARPLTNPDYPTQRPKKAKRGKGTVPMTLKIA